MVVTLSEVVFSKRRHTNLCMIEGCPSHLGCFKEAKRILKFLIDVANNLQLEISYLKERQVMLPNDYNILLNAGNEQ
jgi:hypothetical protein